jgi:tRNA 2-thiouridine synthesizing protein A
VTVPAEDRTLDCRGLLCPMPVVRCSREMKGLEPGQVLKLLATDRGAVTDIPAWAADTGNELLEWHEEGATLVFYLRRGAPE